MQITEIKLKWAEYRYKIRSFESKKETELRSKYPDMAEEDILKKISNAVNRKFKNEARSLLKTHMSVTR